MKGKFQFFVPLSIDIEKSLNENGTEIMKVGGIASTSEKDTDGEFLNPEGFDVSYFLNQGFLNWHHQAKNDPNSIIGEPTKAEIRPEGLYIEGFLYPENQIAQAVWNTAQTLKNNSSTRQLGFSIEGKATKRKNNNPKHPDYKIIEKAAITGCAITFSPKNPKTFLDIIKGEVDDDYSPEYDDSGDFEIIKDMSAGSVTGTETTNSTTDSGAPLKLDSTGSTGGEKKKKASEEDGSEEVKDLLSKTECYEVINDLKKGLDIYGIEKIYKHIEKSNMESGKMNIERTDIEKAIQLLDAQEELLSKAQETEDEEEKESLMNLYKERKSELVELESKLGIPSSPTNGKNELSNKEDIEDANGGATSELSKGSSEMKLDSLYEDTFSKAIDSVVENMNGKFKDVGLIMKHILTKMEGFNEVINTVVEKSEASQQLITETMDLVKSNIEENLDIKKSFDGVFENLGEVSNSINELSKGLEEPSYGRKSTPVAVRERKFVGSEVIEKANASGKSVIHAANKQQVISFLDKITFEKGYDDELGKALTGFEVGVPIPQQTLVRIAAEYNTIIA